MVGAGYSEGNMRLKSLPPVLGQGVVLMGEPECKRVGGKNV